MFWSQMENMFNVAEHKDIGFIKVRVTALKLRS